MTATDELEKFSRKCFKILSDTEDKDQITEIEAELSEKWKKIDSEVAQGLGYELWLWVGLKKDNPEMAKDYSKGIVEVYSKFIN